MGVCGGGGEYKTQSNKGGRHRVQNPLDDAAGTGIMGLERGLHSGIIPGCWAVVLKRMDCRVCSNEAALRNRFPCVTGEQISGLFWLLSTGRGSMQPNGQRHSEGNINASFIQP